MLHPSPACRMPLCRVIIRLSWTAPLLLAIAGCGLLDKRHSQSKSDESTDSVETRTSDLPENSHTTSDLAPPIAPSAAERASWRLPPEAQMELASLHIDPIVSRHPENRSAPTHLGPVPEELVPPAQREQGFAPTSAPLASADMMPVGPRIAEASLARQNLNGKVEQVGGKEFPQTVLNSKAPVLVDFYADWCGPCKQLSPVLDDMARQRPDLKVVKVNFDHDKRLAREYGVTSLPTLVVFENGNVVGKHVGLVDIRKALGR